LEWVQPTVITFIMHTLQSIINKNILKQYIYYIFSP